MKFTKEVTPLFRNIRRDDTWHRERQHFAKTRAVPENTFNGRDILYEVHLSKCSSSKVISY